MPQIHQVLESKGVRVSERTVSNLLAGYDELGALQMSDTEQIRTIVAQQSQVILVINGLQPNVGHEVLWVIRDMLSGEILLATPLLSSSRRKLKRTLNQHPGNDMNEVVEEYCQVVRAALTDDGRLSLDASGLRPYRNGESAIDDRLEQVA